MLNLWNIIGLILLIVRICLLCLFFTPITNTMRNKSWRICLIKFLNNLNLGFELIGNVRICFFFNIILISWAGVIKTNFVDRFIIEFILKNRINIFKSIQISNLGSHSIIWLINFVRIHLSFYFFGLRPSINFMNRLVSSFTSLIWSEGWFCIFFILFNSLIILIWKPFE